MASRGAPKGNKNGAHDKPWSAAVRRALLADDGKKLRSLADKLVDEALAGNVQAIKEIGDRMEGKPAQAIVGPGENGEHKVKHRVEMVIVDAT